MKTRELLFKIHGDELLDNVLNLVDRLNEWMEDAEHNGVTPTASMSYTGSYVSVSIGDVLVWDTDGASENDDMSIFGCLRKWRDECEFNQPFFEKLAAFDATLP